jgi:hypothetical protein
LVIIICWLVPVMMVVANEIREEMAYNRTDLNHSLTTWTFTEAQRIAGAWTRCQGTLDQARSTGCPPDVIAANTARQQAAIDEYALRKHTLASYLWYAFIGYWVVPAAFLFAVGLAIAGIRCALRRPPVVKSPVNH